MSKFLTFLMAITFIMLLPGSASAGQTVDDAAQAIVDQLIEGWNAGDGKAFASPFREDAGYRVWNGMLSEGRDEIARNHQQVFDTIFRGTNLTLKIQKIRPLTDRVVVVYLEGRIYRDGEPLEQLPNMKGAVPVLILVEEEGQWVVGHFQNTPMIQMGPPPGVGDDG